VTFELENDVEQRKNQVSPTQLLECLLIAAVSLLLFSLSGSRRGCRKIIAQIPFNNQRTLAARKWMGCNSNTTMIIAAPEGRAINKIYIL